MRIIPLPAFSDNYLWLVTKNHHAIVIDPGEAEPVLAALKTQACQLNAIFLTHAHHDHIDGVSRLVSETGCAVYGDPEISWVTHPVKEGDTITPAGLETTFLVWAVPGHTPNHLAYLAQTQPAALFCGDTLFSAGCGRLLGGTAAELYASLKRIARLPGETLLYPAHEYTLANLRFSKVVEPHNPLRDHYEQQCQNQRAAGKPTLPTTVTTEWAVNPFLRTTEPAIRHAVEAATGQTPPSELATFTALRAWKDQF